MGLELDLQSSYNPDGSPRTDLPTGEVLAWDGKDWGNGFLYVHFNKVGLIDDYDLVVLSNVVRFAPLPTIIEDDTTTL